MTNALAQNIDVNNYAIEMLSQTTSAVSVNQPTKEISKFSNMMNGLEARVNKVQKGFDKNAKVTNTSSINQKALVKETAKKEIKTTTSNDARNNLSNNVKTETKVDSKVETTVLKTKAIKSDDSTVQTEKMGSTENATEEDKLDFNTIQISQKESEENLSDINNSSPVETSPVFSSDEVVINEDTKIKLETALNETKDVVNEILNSNLLAEAVVVVEKPQQEIVIEQDDVQLTLSDEINKTVEEISTYLDNADINQETKEQILNAIEEVKKVLSGDLNQFESIQDFEKTLNELKEKISQIYKEELPELKLNDVKKLDELLNKIDLKKDVKINADSFEVDNDLEVNTENDIKIELPKELEDFFKKIEKDINEIIDLNDVRKIDDFSKELPKLIENVKKLSEEMPEIVQKLTQSLESLEGVLSETFEKKDFFVVENLTSDDLKNLKVEEQQTMNELLNVLENINSKLDIQENEDIKLQIEDLIKKISSGEISNEQLTKAIDNISDEIKTEIKMETSLDVDTTTERVIKISNELENSKNNDQKNESFKDENEIEIEDIDIQDVPEIDLEQEVQLKANVSKDVNVKSLEQNLQKTIAIQDMLDDMIVEVDIKTIPVQSGALSVVDEVTKLAMGENNTLNSIFSSNTVTYDSTGVGAVIKNVAQLTKTAQVQTPSETPSMEDLMNQVTNKITQLKDSSAQKLTLVLRPNDLGRLQIELTSNQNGLTTQIMAQNEQVRAYIEKNIDSLRLQLSENGVNVNSIQIRSAGSDSATTYDGNQNLARQQDENLNQQNNKQNQQHEQKNNNKDAKEMLASMSNYDMSFVKDFSNVLNKSLNYSLN